MNIATIAEKAKKALFFMIPVWILLMILYPVFHFKGNKGTENQPVASGQQSQKPRFYTSFDQSRPPIQVIRPGEVVKIPIRSRKIRFLNDLNGLRFKVYDASDRLVKIPDSNGNLVEESDKLMDWGPFKGEYLSFRTTTDAKEWFVDWWY